MIHLTIPPPQHRYYPYILPALVLGTFLVAWILPSPERAILLLTCVGTVVAWVFLLYRQHHDRVRLAKELFLDFNARYDALNKELHRIRARDSRNPPSTDEQETLADYFNLCAEEYLFYKAGWIDEDIWQSWRNGMQVFSSVPRIREFWEKELSRGSYYGFSLEAPVQLAIPRDVNTTQVAAATAVDQRTRV